MALINEPLYTTGGSHSSKGDRFALKFMAGDSQGVASPTSLQVTSASNGFRVIVAAGFAVIDGTVNPSEQGGYGFANDADIELNHDPSDVANSRIDLIVARVEDTQFTGASDQTFLEIVRGTPAGIPIEPTVTTDNTMVLAAVSIPAGSASITNSEITDRRVNAASGGSGSIHVASTGTETAPGHTFDGAANTGLYSTGNDVVVTADGTNVVSHAKTGTGETSTRHLNNGTWQAPGSAGALIPEISGKNGPNTGLKIATTSLIGMVDSSIFFTMRKTGSIKTLDLTGADDLIAPATTRLGLSTWNNNVEAANQLVNHAVNGTTMMSLQQSTYDIFGSNRTRHARFGFNPSTTSLQLPDYVTFQTNRNAGFRRNGNGIQIMALDTRRANFSNDHTEMYHGSTSAAAATYGEFRFQDDGYVSAFRGGTGAGNVEWASWWAAAQYSAATSDEKLKKDIEDISSSASLIKINSLRPRTFNWKEHEETESPGFDHDTIQTGFIAQEVQTVLPDLVTEKIRETESGVITTLQLSMLGMIPHLVASIQELTARIVELENGS